MREPVSARRLRQALETFGGLGAVRNPSARRAAPPAPRAKPGKKAAARTGRVKGLPRFLYHGTPAQNLPSILREGLSPSRATSSQEAVYLAGSRGTAANYAGMYRDDEFAMLRVDTSVLDPALLGPDDYELQDLLDDNERSEGENYPDLAGIDRWNHVSWQDSLRHADQVVYRGVIPPSALTLLEGR